MKKISLIGILGIFLIIVAVSGCASSSTGNSTMKYSTVSFLYPSDMTNATESNIISGSKNWQTISFMANDKVNMLFQKYNGQLDPSEAVASDEASVRENNGNVTSTTDEKNSNGVEISGDIETLADPSSNEVLTYHDMTFVSGGVTYSISIYGSDTQSVSQAYQMAYNSLKV